jgi:hypothetical protein
VKSHIDLLKARADHPTSEAATVVASGKLPP